MEAIVKKLGSSATKAVALPDLPFIPETQAQVERLITERPDYWEYRLFAALIRINMAALEPEYRDFAIGFARPNGKVVSGDEILEFCKTELTRVHSITQNIELVLAADTQAQAFGVPGQAGDPERITHLATRFISIYEDLMTWATNLRATATASDDGVALLRALARFAEQPIEACRQTVAHYAENIVELPRLVEEGDGHVDLAMSIVFDVPSEVSQTYTEALARAFE